MRKNDEKFSVVTAIIVIASAIVVAAGVIIAFKKLCDKYSITVRKPKKKFIDFDDADDWTIDECDCADIDLDDYPDEACPCDDDAAPAAE